VKNNKHMDFLKKIRISESQAKKKDNNRGVYDNATHRKTEQEKLNIQKELERRIEELFGAAEED
jgi:hypothetical protein